MTKTHVKIRIATSCTTCHVSGIGATPQLHAVDFNSVWHLIVVSKVQKVHMRGHKRERRKRSLKEQPANYLNSEKPIRDAFQLTGKSEHQSYRGHVISGIWNYHSTLGFQQNIDIGQLDGCNKWSLKGHYGQGSFSEKGSCSGSEFRSTDVSCIWEFLRIRTRGGPHVFSLIFLFCPLWGRSD